MILVIGSVNIDHAYRVARHPGPGETIPDLGYQRGLGGKGANQALAACCAGATVVMAGAVGEDGKWCRDHLQGQGVDVAHMPMVGAATGHAIIMVDQSAENTIVIHGGANRALTEDQIDAAIAACSAGDWILLQNETNLVTYAAAKARSAGLCVAYAAAPFDPSATEEILPHADLLAVNEVEAAQLAQHIGQPIEALDLPGLLVTRGAEGATYRTSKGVSDVDAFAVDAVDTTGAGDTFLGYFLAALDHGHPPEDALRSAAAAAALQVTRHGAGEAIPSADEVDTFLANAASGSA